MLCNWPKIIYVLGGISVLKSPVLKVVYVMSACLESAQRFKAQMVYIFGDISETLFHFCDNSKFTFREGENETRHYDLLQNRLYKFGFNCV